MWAASARYDTAAGVVRVQSNDAASPVVTQLLGPGLPVSDRRAPTRLLSVRLEPVATTGPQPLHLLYDDGCLQLRSHDHRRVLDSLADAVRGEPAEQDLTRLRLRGCALVDDGGALLLPAELRPHVALHERRLNRAGLGVVDGHDVGIDAESGHLVVPPMERTPTAASGLYAGREAGAAAPGRARVRVWMLDDLPTANDPRRQPGVELVRNLDALRPWRARAILTRLELGARLVRTWDPWPDDIVAALIELAGGPDR